MRILLDTHVFHWYISADPKLPSAYRTAIQDPANEIFLSAASVWEAVIKSQLGKLPLPAPPADYLPQQREAHGIAALPIDEGAMSALASLRRCTATPSDRLLVAQAIQHGMTIATVDADVISYLVPVMPTVS